MGPRLVNTFPGSIAGPVAPNKRVHFGLKSEGSLVNLASLRIKSGLSSLIKGLHPPDQDPLLGRRGAVTELRTSERRAPVVGPDVNAFLSGSDDLVIQKVGNSDSARCVYEIAYPIARTSSILARFRISTSAWNHFNPDWINKTQMTGVYLGLEHGGLNTALYTFLRSNGSGGSLVLGGPLPTLGAARPGEQEISFPWESQALGTAIEVLIFFNLLGYDPPFLPVYTPVAEVWAQIEGEAAPSLQAVIPVADLGQFPSTGSENFRRNNDEDFARLFLGMAGRDGDELTVEDFGLYPDFRFAVRSGVALPGNELEVLPDLPVTYRSSDGRLPRDLLVGPWVQQGLSVKDSLAYATPQKKTVLHASIDKSSPGKMAYMKLEPKVETASPVSSLDGCMIEAVLSGAPTGVDGELFGAGISIDDGTKLYRVNMLRSGDVDTYGVLRSAGQQASFAGYYLPTSEVPFIIPKLVRLVVDRRRDELRLVVEEEVVLRTPLTSGVFPSTDGGHGAFSFGHIANSISAGRVNIGFVNCMSRYLAYEGEDGLLPTAASVAFSAVTANDPLGSTQMTSDAVVISKQAYNTPSSKRYYKRNHSFSEIGGFLVDFKTKIVSYNDAAGRAFSSFADTGAGLTVFLGSKRVQVVFVDCGPLGKKVGIVPGSGSIDDLIEQNELGRRFSAPTSWTTGVPYRLVMRAGVSIELWARDVRHEPDIVIPWRDALRGFDLPLDTTPTSLAFGHFDADSASLSEWSYIRWGSSAGYEAAVIQRYDELPPYLFGGKALILAEIED